jgi:cell division initiation protein
MKIAPLDLRQQRFKTSFRGFDKSDVVAFLTEAADDYEQALRENDRLRQDTARLEVVVGDHREREITLRNTLLTAQKLADEVRETAKEEAKLIVREAEARASNILEKAQTRLAEIEHDINELRLRRRNVEGSLEASIQALYHALEFMRDTENPGRVEQAPQQRPGQAGAAPAPPAADAARKTAEQG